MKEITRLMPIDEVWRIVIPVDIRRRLRIKEKDKLKVYMEGKCVIFEKPTYCCRLCGNGEKLTEFKEQVLCTDCIENISRTFLNLEKGEFVNMKELEEEIEKGKKELDMAIEQNKEYPYIYQKSVELDEVIAKYMRIMYENNKK